MIVETTLAAGTEWPAGYQTAEVVFAIGATRNDPVIICKNDLPDGLTVGAAIHTDDVVDYMVGNVTKKPIKLRSDVVLRFDVRDRFL